MAQSHAHALGQIIGDQLEVALYDPLAALAAELGLYLDYKHPRPARDDRSIVSWVDGKGNKHDLDYVFEKGGSENDFGNPKAFIECAWRRYTKHSKNKAQEIEGAVGHLRAQYADHQPALAAVLGGEFTEPSLQQLRSHGFIVLHFSYNDVAAAFDKVGVDIRTEEDTSERAIQSKVKSFNKLSAKKRRVLLAEIRTICIASINVFLDDLRVALTRVVERIVISPLFAGDTIDVGSIDEAVRAIDRFDEASNGDKFARFEVDVRYSNGSEIRGTFQTKAEAKAFLLKAI